MLIRKPSDIPSSLITPREHYLNRRRFLRGALSGAAVAGAAALGIDRAAELISPRARVFAGTKLETVKSPLYHYRRAAHPLPRTSPATTTSTSSASRKATHPTTRAACPRAPGRSVSKAK